MSPEQIRSEPADVRSDLFALGCVLYECLTGRRAFWGATSQDVFAQVLQAHPAPPSEFSGAVTPAHDAIVARLMQKSPADRFQTAAEALAAIREITGGTATRTRPAPAPRKWPIEAIVVGVIGVIAFAAYFLWPRTGLPVPPPESAKFYNEAVDAIRDGRYVAARSLLQEAVNGFPQFAQAHLRLAEAHIELDEELAAKNALLRFNELVPDVGRLPQEEQLRVSAIRSFVLRNYRSAAQNYTKLADLQPADAGRWLDVGRAEEAAALRGPAAKHYERALSLDRTYAAAHLRLASVRGRTGKLADVLTGFDEAARLYRTRGQNEGEVEVLVRRGNVLRSRGSFKEAQSALGRVKEMTAGTQYVHQRVRAEIDLGGLMAANGHFAEAEAIGRAAVKAARDSELWGTAANGQIDVAITLMLSRDLSRATQELTEAIALAKEHGARLTELRATLQKAALLSDQRKIDDAIELLKEPLAFFKDHDLPQFEIAANNILTRIYEDREEYEQAGIAAAASLKAAETIEDRPQIITARGNVASLLAKQGRLPEALSLRQQLEELNRSNNDHAALAYDLGNRAELLIRLGRGPEADEALAEFERQADAGIEAYVKRRDRLLSLRALLAATRHQFADVLRYAGEAERLTSRPDIARNARILVTYASAMTGRAAKVTIGPPSTDPGSATDNREGCYWEALALLRQQQFQRALDVAQGAWSAPGAKGNPELRWRLAALAWLAAQNLKPVPDDSANMRALAQSDWNALEKSWGEATRPYISRPDIVALRQRLS